MPPKVICLDCKAATFFRGSRHEEEMDCEQCGSSDFMLYSKWQKEEAARKKAEEEAIKKAARKKAEEETYGTFSVGGSSSSRAVEPEVWIKALKMKKKAKKEAARKKAAEEKQAEQWAKEVLGE